MVAIPKQNPAKSTLVFTLIIDLPFPGFSLSSHRPPPAPSNIIHGDHRRLAVVETEGLRRAGYTVSGSPANLALGRTLRNSMSRRIALKRPKPEEIAELEKRIEALHSYDPELPALREKLERMREKSKRIAYVDPLDLRFRRFEPYPKPIAQAVMFCLMDVSASMTEAKKDLAKRFFTLLYIFLARKYQQVQVVFIRHTEEAEEVEEQEFFHGTASGGTVVLSALEMMKDTIEKRFPPSAWNIYAAQASDGDAFGADPEKSRGYLMQHLLPASRGGANTWLNTVAACTRCNNVKANRTPAEASMPLRRAPHVPAWREAYHRRS